MDVTDSERALGIPVLAKEAVAFALLGYDLGVHEGYKWHGPRVQLGIDRLFWNSHLRAGLSWNLQYLDFFAINEESFASAQRARRSPAGRLFSG